MFFLAPFGFWLFSCSLLPNKVQSSCSFLKRMVAFAHDFAHLYLILCSSQMTWPVGKLHLDHGTRGLVVLLVHPVKHPEDPLQLLLLEPIHEEICSKCDFEYSKSKSHFELFIISICPLWLWLLAFGPLCRMMFNITEWRLSIPFSIHTLIDLYWISVYILGILIKGLEIKLINVPCVIFMTHVTSTFDLWPLG